MHLAGLAGPLTAAIFFWKIPAVPFLISLLPLSWARLYLRKHNIWQVLAGIMMSSLITYLTCYFLTLKS
jgi:membrane-associated phospholipid phosphatase